MNHHSNLLGLAKARQEELRQLASNPQPQPARKAGDRLARPLSWALRLSSASVLALVLSLVLYE